MIKKAIKYIILLIITAALLSVLFEIVWSFMTRSPGTQTFINTEDTICFEGSIAGFFIN
jgi:hypothetical protein